MSNTLSKPLLRDTLLVTLFCYLPQWDMLSWWLSFTIFMVIGYRLLANRYDVPLPNQPIKIIIVMIFFILFLFLRRFLISSKFYIDVLLTFVALKCFEIHSTRDLRVIILCHFYVILSVLLLHQSLWVFVYLLMAVWANLWLMLKVTSPLAAFQNGGKSVLKGLMVAIPMSLLLFYLFPRLSTPLWRVPSLSQTKTGFNDEMSMGNLSELFADDSTVMRVRFKTSFKANMYWRGVVLTQFNGLSWKPEGDIVSKFEKLPIIDKNQIASYEVLLEPHQKKWLFYQDKPSAANPELMFASSLGLVQQDNSLVIHRLMYALIDVPDRYLPITPKDIQQNTHLPPYGNPRLRAWAKQQFVLLHNNIPAMIHFLENYIHQQPFWYSLMPVNAGLRPNLMDEFWFETRRGYCEYYTSAVAIILRAVGIPARVVVGYHGGKWNPIAQLLTVEQNQAHAWLEYWQEGIGWNRFDPITFIADERIDQTIHQKQAEASSIRWFSQWNQLSSTLPWMIKASYVLESVNFFWERWLLFYNQDSQQVLLQKMGFEHWDATRLLQASITFLVLFFLIGSVWYLWRQRVRIDVLIKEYQCVEKEMKRLGISTGAPTTFTQQLQRLSEQQPAYRVLLTQCIAQYEQLRLKQSIDHLDHRTRTRQLLRALYQKLRKMSIV